MRTGYSFLIRPLLLIIDISIITSASFLFLPEVLLDLNFLLYINLAWILISYSVGYYKVYRYTSKIKLISLLLRNLLIFLMAYLSYLSIFRTNVFVSDQQLYMITIASGVSVSKFITFFLLRVYRKIGRNFRRVVVIGSDKSAKTITNLFNTSDNLGYRLLGFFSDRESNSEEYLGHVSDSYDYIIENGVHEIYCSSVASASTIKEMTSFAKEHHIIIKLIPDVKNIYGKNFSLEYYKTVPVLSIKNLPFENIETRIVKRIFDIIFSICVCVLILSWLVPLMWILIKLESKGPLFFKQKRGGLKGNEFVCYKFRSMRINDQSDSKQVSMNDERITKIGKFIRKTSIDEIPQFINVLIGDMSVIGPRPHMNKQSLKFEKEINNYIRRNAVKPGISGLAQVSGFRGEIRKKSDIENRVRLDVFYIENWSFFLDIKIILTTITNLFKGEEKAY